MTLTLAVRESNVGKGGVVTISGGVGSGRVGWSGSEVVDAGRGVLLDDACGRGELGRVDPLPDLSPPLARG